jgi:hypothetical protein
LSEQEYQKLVGETDLGVKKDILEKAREYLQVQFRTLEVGSHIYSLKDFWVLPDGLFLVSFWFEWVTGGSKEGWLSATVQRNLEPVLVVVSEILIDKKGELWRNRFEEAVNNAEANNGNKTMVWVFLIREWSRMYKEKAQRVIFIEGEDQIQDMSKQPFIHIRRVAQPGEDYDQKVVVSVMCGNTLVFEDVGFGAALACIVEISFIFNLSYDKDADSTLNFIQRILAGFGETDGARNEKGKVKSSYISFEREFGKLMVAKNLGAVKMLFDSSL